jgi:hypothetical protein
VAPDLFVLMAGGRIQNGQTRKELTAGTEVCRRCTDADAQVTVLEQPPQRRHRGPGGEEKTSCVHVLYATSSSEEHIYGKLDWDETTGIDRNRFFLWGGEGQPEPQPGPPRSPLPTEVHIDADALVEGGRYPGQYEGVELTCNSRGNISNPAGLYAAGTGALAGALLRMKAGGGKFRVTPKRQFVLVRVPAGEEWETLYVTRLAHPLRFVEPDAAVDPAEALRWQLQAHPGDPYPFEGLALREEDLRFKRKSGGVISKKVRGGEVFARLGDRATDPAKGGDGARLVAAIQTLQKAGKQVSRLAINVAGHATFRENGQLFFVCVLDHGLEFPAGPAPVVG